MDKSKLNLKLNMDKLLVYLVFLIPVYHLILIFLHRTSTIFSELSLTQYMFVILIVSYYLIFKNKLFKLPLIGFLILYFLNILLADNSWTSIVYILPINVVINLSILFYSNKIKMIEINSKLKNLIFFIILISFYSFLIGIEFISPHYEGLYHSGIFSLPHEIAYYLLIIFVYTNLIDKKINIFYILSFLGIILTGVRTVIVSLIFFMILNMILHFNILNKKNFKIFINYVAIALLSVTTFHFVKIEIVNKIILRCLNLFDFTNIATYGSGRGSIFQVLLSDIKDRDVFELLFGKPLEQVYIILEHKLGSAMWAHNDFIMILFVLGIVGVLIYVYYLFINPISYLKKNSKGAKEGLLVLSCIFLLAVGNGFYLYYMGNILLYILALVGLKDRGT